MCGIAGIISPNPQHRNQELLRTMTQQLAHRGPDGEGFWTDNRHVSFGHRRLAIIDLTGSGHQPMHYLERYTITYNGEIYNYKEIRADLIKQGYNFKSLSDTEVILAAYDCYKERCVSYLDGMFAFAIWDKIEERCYAARDRFGEKPFYYSVGTNIFVFASEMKALWAYGIEKTPDNRMVLNYLTLGYVQNPADKSQTFYENISSLPPAHYLIIDTKDYKVRLHQYYDVDKQSVNPIKENEAIKYIDTFLHSSIKTRLRSDVKVGASLSGGLDSSTLAWYIQQQEGINIEQFPFFTATFPGFERDEGRFIQSLQQSISLNHIPITPNAASLISDFERLMYHQEEPFTSSSIFAQYKIYQAAQENGVKVILEGQGADEIFAGYHRYLHWYLQELLSRHRFSRYRKEKKALSHPDIKLKWSYKNYIASFLPSHVAIALEKAEYQRIIHHPHISKEFLSCTKGSAWEGVHKPIITKLNDILYFNTMRLGLEELLRFADRSSMSFGVEVRLPFLQPDLVDFIFSLRSDLKINNGYTKNILRRLMTDRLPENIVWRKDKIGFEPPQKTWMQEPGLQEYIHHSKETLVDAGLLKPSVLQQAIRPKDAHEANNYDWRYLCTAQLYKTTS